MKGKKKEKKEKGKRRVLFSSSCQDRFQNLFYSSTVGREGKEGLAAVLVRYGTRYSG